jgi:hypothetical protein
MVKGNASVRNGLVVLLILAICLGISLVGKPSSLSQIVHEITSTSTSSVESPRVLLRNDKKNNSIVVVGKPSVPLQNQNEKADSFHFPSIQKHTAVEHLSGPITTRQYTAIWDLLPWEEASRNAQCVGPLTGGVSSLAIRDPAAYESLSKTTEGSGQTCCPGAIGVGGRLTYNGLQSNCHGDMFDRVAAAVKTYLARNYDNETSSTSSSTRNNNTYKPCDACRIVDLLILHNWTLTFSGDSMMRQTFVGLQCEIMRRISSEASNNSNNTISYNFKVLPRVPWPRLPETFWRRGIADIHEVHISHANPAHRQQDSNSNSNNYARILYFSQYRPLDDNNTELEYIAQQSDIIVFDHGLHYVPHQYDDMINRTRSMLPTLGGGRHVKLVAWRETSAQHFNTTHGEYSASVIQKGCNPIQRAPRPGYTLRSDNMMEAARLANWTVAWANDPDFATTRPPPLIKAGQKPSETSSSSGNSRGSTILGELVILPFREFTHDLHYAHGTECTHYCSSPHLWLPVWRALRLAMDRLFL